MILRKQHCEQFGNCLPKHEERYCVRRFIPFHLSGLHREMTLTSSCTTPATILLFQRLYEPIEGIFRYGVSLFFHSCFCVVAPTWSRCSSARHSRKRSFVIFLTVKFRGCSFWFVTWWQQHELATVSYQNLQRWQCCPLSTDTLAAWPRVSPVASFQFQTKIVCNDCTTPVKMVRLSAWLCGDLQILVPWRYDIKGTADLVQDKCWRAAIDIIMMIKRDLMKNAFQQWQDFLGYLKSSCQWSKCMDFQGLPPFFIISDHVL